MTVCEFNLNFRKHFPQAPYCLDHLCTMAYGKTENGTWRAHIDIIKLDNWLIRRHGKYTGSMNTRVQKLFGDDAVAFIQQCL
jgi:hypothetical protein